MTVIVDTGPLVALFDPKDPDHEQCAGRARKLGSKLVVTLPVLTDAFHILRPASRGADNLRQFIRAGAAAIHNPGENEIERAFELMEQYGDLPMDFADASIVVAAESFATRKVFTLDERDFRVYRVKRGHRRYPVEIV